LCIDTGFWHVILSITDDFPTFQTYIKWLNKAIFTENTDYNLILSLIKNNPLKRSSKPALFVGVFLVFSTLIAYPHTAKASFLSMIAGFFSTPADASNDLEIFTPNLQNIDLPKAVLSSNPISIKGDQTPVIIDDSSLISENDPAGNGTSTATSFDNSQITTYVVRNGDILSDIAKTFGITVNTIMIANDMASQKLKEGQHLIILPVSGVQHTVKSGETLSGIAKTYKITTQDILQYNYFESGSLLAVGDQIFVPVDKLPVKTVAKSSPLIKTVGYFIKPLVNYHKTQGLHGHNGIDLGAPVGEPILAAASGKVVISRAGWNGGYGNYIVIQHDNGMQTVYGHASKLLVSEGDTVKQGQKIALVGSTGQSTGPHLHVEVRGGTNPF